MRCQIAGQILKNSENWVLAILGVLGTVFVIQTFGYRFSAALFPRLVNTVLVALCLFRLGGNIFRTCAGRTIEGEQEEETRPGLPWYWSLFITVLYFGTIYLIGFVFATGLFLVAFPITAGYRRWTVIFVIAIVTAILTEICFNMFLQMQLPEGVLFSLLKQ